MPVLRAVRRSFPLVIAALAVTAAAPARALADEPAPAAAPAAPAAPAAAPDDAGAAPAPVDDEVYQWRVSIGAPEDAGLRDGAHIQIWWKRYYHGAPARMFVFRRVVADHARFDPHLGFVEPDPEPHQGLGPPDLQEPDQFGAKFTAGFLSTQDQLASTKHPGKPVKIAGHTFAVGEQVGRWTLLAIDDDDRTLVDAVRPGARYLYAIVPTTPGDAPGTVTGFPEPGVQSWAVAPEPGILDTPRWIQLAILAGAALAALVTAVRLRPRAPGRAPGRAPRRAR